MAEGLKSPLRIHADLLDVQALRSSWKACALIYPVLASFFFLQFLILLGGVCMSLSFLYVYRKIQRSIRNSTSSHYLAIA